MSEGVVEASLLQLTELVRAVRVVHGGALRQASCRQRARSQSSCLWPAGTLLGLGLLPTAMAPGPRIRMRSCLTARAGRRAGRAGVGAHRCGPSIEAALIDGHHNAPFAARIKELRRRRPGVRAAVWSPQYPCRRPLGTGRERVREPVPPADVQKVSPPALCCSSTVPSGVSPQKCVCVCVG